MAINNFTVCPICGTKLKKEIHISEYYNFYVACDTCGRFSFDDDFYDDYIEGRKSKISKSQFASYLYYHEDRLPLPYFCTTNIDIPRNHRFVDVSEVENWYPKTFSEKVDIFLLGLSSRANYMSEIVMFSNEQLVSACFATREPLGTMRKVSNVINDQINFFIDYMIKQEYIEAGTNRCMILPKGLQRVDSLQKNNSKTSKNVFVAMSFDPKMKEVREAIKKAITECGYIPRIMDEIEHNHQIVPEMLYEIRQARFVVAELTGHNNGAYFEAGYALGYDKEVIQVCEKSKFGEDGHFDVKQINTVLWETPEDLTNKLIARIKATIS